MQVDLNLLLVLVALFVVAWMSFGNGPQINLQVDSTEKPTLVDRTGADWNESGALTKTSGLDNAVPEPPFMEESVRPKGRVTPLTKDQTSGPGFRDSYGQFKTQDEIYPNYYNKYEVFTSDYFPWWRNQHYWPYYTRSHNWMYRYPFYSYWRRPYYYNYWASPYYPSKTVLIKPYVKDMVGKNRLQHQLEAQLRSHK